MKKQYKVFAGISALVLASAAAFYQGLITKRYRISSKKVKSNEDSAKFLMLSDLHSYGNLNYRDTVLKKTCEQMPDAIFLVGDMVDNILPQEGAFRLLRDLPNIAPTYYVSGNHEFWSEDPEQIFRDIVNCGIRVLRQETVVLTKGKTAYTISGVDDPAIYGTGKCRSYGDKENYQKALHTIQEQPADAVHILLAHRPEYFEQYVSLPFDLVLCGHAHGGQWRIPFFINGVYAPNQGMFPKIAGGRYEKNGTTEIVGRGLVRNRRPRIFNPPELIVIDIVSKSRENAGESPSE